MRPIAFDLGTAKLVQGTNTSPGFGSAVAASLNWKWITSSVKVVGAVTDASVFLDTTDSDYLNQLQVLVTGAATTNTVTAPLGTIIRPNKQIKITNNADPATGNAIIDYQEYTLQFGTTTRAKSGLGVRVGGPNSLGAGGTYTNQSSRLKALIANVGINPTGASAGVAVAQLTLPGGAATTIWRMRLEALNTPMMMSGFILLPPEASATVGVAAPSANFTIDSVFEIPF